jgi:hypothetical protein
VQGCWHWPADHHARNSLPTDIIIMVGLAALEQLVLSLIYDTSPLVSIAKKKVGLGIKYGYTKYILNTLLYFKYIHCVYLNIHMLYRHVHGLSLMYMFIPGIYLIHAFGIHFFNIYISPQRDFCALFMC